jgi:hypothetical protein
MKRLLRRLGGWARRPRGPSRTGGTGIALRAGRTNRTRGTSRTGVAFRAGRARCTRRARRASGADITLGPCRANCTSGTCIALVTRRSFCTSGSNGASWAGRTYGSCRSRRRLNFRNGISQLRRTHPSKHANHLPTARGAPDPQQDEQYDGPDEPGHQLVRKPISVLHFIPPKFNVGRTLAATAPEAKARPRQADKNTHREWGDDDGCECVGDPGRIAKQNLSY